MKSKKFKTMLATLTLIIVSCVVSLSAFAQNSNAGGEEPLTTCADLIFEVEALEAEADEVYGQCAAARDKAVRELAAESAVRAGLQVDNAKLRKALDAEREERVRLEATRPSRLVWYTAGAATGVVATVVVFILVQ